jgi:putative CocE/NonD family hydrolase
MLALAAATRARAQGFSTRPGATPIDSVAVDVQWGVRIPLRDGTTLHATLYRPANDARSLPAILTMTPYTTDEYHARGMYFARRGFVFAAVDIRGRGNSAGKYAPFVRDGVDGYDVVEWLASSRGVNGNVVMWGGSYGGFVQWATAKERPPHLRAIAPAAAVYPGFDFPTLRGITFVAAVNWLAGTGGRTANSQLDGDGTYWMQKVRELQSRRLPFRVLDSLSGVPSAVFQEWLAHPHWDAYWASMVPTATQYAAIDLPILTITGYYDVDQPGALRYYREHQQHASPAARARHWLLIGPWDHAGTRTPQQRFSGVTMGPRSVVDLAALHVQWYRHVLEGSPRPTSLAAPVRYYMPGDDQWRDAATVDALTARRDTLWLQPPTVGAALAATSGTLAWRAPSTPWQRQMVFSPSDSVALERDTRRDPFNYARHARAASSRAAGMQFETAPLRAPVRLAGRVAFDAWLRVDTDDVDIAVDLFEVRRDGSVLWLTGDMLRGRYRNGRDTPTLLPIGHSAQWRFDEFSVFARRLDAGSRLRLVLSTPNRALYEPQFGGVEVPSAQRPLADRSVTVHVLSEGGGRSPVLTIPVAR